ncbi:hypothetical protein GUITHDRAFT_106688 [Guillardia theta CCMP2712]|uniref:Uncharacterized protein n=1 Tax=Guillardia theta (strain CCMP2712) TaxID=905079 RepID=L1JHS7_GUITC|nr:hypothetical protein GUITHDRAFT_106688 [Guillardia theta CCMP2712]EKX47699.1 hypothetical protein GUITHDRAFT_106688 [Guillardia theta CCMP2712]|eukprot:XP_005834679.1 hypothetical protein GUITHDRAFT_106688 [Guillardia theta CCMP2712]
MVYVDGREKEGQHVVELALTGLAGTTIWNCIWIIILSIPALWVVESCWAHRRYRQALKESPSEGGYQSAPDQPQV